MIARSSFLAHAALGLLAVAAACKKDPPPVMLPNDPAQERTAQSFVHCMEASGSQCVEPADQLAGWDAFYLLVWLSGGSPAAILEALPTALADHADPRRVQRRFVDEVERYYVTVRGAGCESTSSQPIDPLIDQVTAVATERLRKLGLWQAGMQAVAQGLAEEAHEGLRGGFLVRLDCERDPFRLYVATRERDGHHAVVGMTTLMPEVVGGDPPSREIVSERLRSRALGLSEASAPVVEGVVDPWLAFPVEEL